jgi:MYXO-CTERM domain-containing protein
MSGALRKGLLASGFLGTAGFLLAVACSEQGAEQSAAQQSLGKEATSQVARRPARADLASLTSKATVQLTSNGRVLVPVSHARPGDASSLSLGMELPTAADGAVRLHPSSHPQSVLAMTPALAAKSAATIGSDGSAVYERAFGSADLVQSATLDGLRTQIAIQDGKSPDLFVWRTELADGLRAVARDDLGTDLIDAKGVAALAVSPVTITDARGVATSATLHFDGDGYARLRVEHKGLEYPALIDFAVTLGNVQALAIAPTQIKGRVMVLLDTSGSMLEQFGNNTNTHGDSPVGNGTARMCDNALGGSTFACTPNVACTIANGALNFWPVAAAANPSRMLASKLALQNVVNANAGLLDFGLERYAEDAGCPNTTNPAYCCNSQINGTTAGRCQDRDNYTDMPPAGDANDLTYAGSCGTPYRGGRVLIQPGAGSSTQLLPWVDFTEDFCSSTGTVGGAPRNPELRAVGNTPLGRAVRNARTDWFQPTYTDSKTAGVQPLDDSLIDCRPYVLVVMTDGDDTCEAGTTHLFDCAGNNAQCTTNRCFSADVAGSSNPTSSCQCATNGDCTGDGQTCLVAATPVDCNDNVALCGAASACVDTPGGGSNFRCSCAADADCGTGFTCNTTTPPAVDCRGDDNRCISNDCFDAPGPGTNFRCSCTGNAQCAASQQCTGGICVTRGVCQAAGQCQIADPTPHAQVQSLTDVNVTNPVKTYVLGMGDPAGLNQTELNAMAVSGGTAQARFATSQSDIEAAFADIVANTVKFEICNSVDDNCNARIDEGLGVYQECLINTDCTGGATCNAGRCVCANQTQCGAGFTCSAETPLHFCRPSCSEGQGACLVAGVRKCGVGVGQCCVNNNSATCTDIVPPAGTAEVCNGLDDNCNGFVDENLSCQGCVPLPEVCDGKDNDCDGLKDETGPGGLVDIGGPCGSSVGRCTPGTAVCTNGTLTCSGDTGPFAEVCNGYDDDCDGVTDGMSQACYTGPPATRGVNSCHDGSQICTAVSMSGVEMWGTCTGQQLPTPEICNGLDDDCDGIVDNGIPTPTPGQVTGDACCSDKAPGTKCGTGQCVKGTWVCAGSVVVCANAGSPTNETCDNADNDCDGTIDNIPTVGGPCVAPGSCAGTLKCDSDLKQLVCEPKGATAVEVCNGMDDDCDGKTDEIEDVSVNDDWYGDDCNAPPAGHDQPPCKPGKYVCKNGAKFCEGDVQPLDHEVCDLKDNDCDGIADTLAACPGVNACVQGVCVEPCHGGEFPCPGGYDCQSFPDPAGGKNNKKFCVPTTCNDVECPPGASCQNGKCTLESSGGAGNAGGAGPGPEGGDSSSSSGAGNSPEGGDNGGPGSGGSSATGGTGKAGSNGTAATGNTSTETEAHGVFGLATGGGGCACRSAPSQGGKWATLASLLLVGSVLGRRRRSAKRRAA